jgi:hypothetical protein
MAADDFMAAQMIRDLARKENEPLVKRAKLADISVALKVVLRRYSQSRRKRAAAIVQVSEDTAPVENGHAGERPRGGVP